MSMAGALMLGGGKLLGVYESFGDTPPRSKRHARDWRTFAVFIHRQDAFEELHIFARESKANREKFTSVASGCG
jgi:hypothetical protein